MDTRLAKVDVRICRASVILSTRQFEPGLISGFFFALGQALALARAVRFNPPSKTDT